MAHCAVNQSFRFTASTLPENHDTKKMSVLQKKINEIKNQAIIGLEYVIEVHFASNFECVYHCVLCEGRFDLTTVVSHLTAYNHRLKYLVSCAYQCLM